MGLVHCSDILTPDAMQTAGKKCPSHLLEAAGGVLPRLTLLSCEEALFYECESVRAFPDLQFVIEEKW